MRHLAGAPPIGWWSPDPRGILRPADLHVSRSLRRSLKGFEVCVDTNFAGVVAGCAEPSRTVTHELPRAARSRSRTGPSRFPPLETGEAAGLARIPGPGRCVAPGGAAPRRKRGAAPSGRAAGTARSGVDPPWMAEMF